MGELNKLVLEIISTKRLIRGMTGGPLYVTEIKMSDADEYFSLIDDLRKLEKKLRKKVGFYRYFLYKYNLDKFGNKYL